MLIIYCDGSTKMQKECVITSAVVGRLLQYKDKQGNSRTVVKELLYCSKKSYSKYYEDSIHELLAVLDAMEVYLSLNTEESLLIISDSKEMVINIQKFINNNNLNIWSGKDISVDLINSLTLKINAIKLKNGTINLEWQSRNILGLNVTDFLNKEPYAWTNSKDKPFLKSQMKKLINRDYDI